MLESDQLYFYLWSHRFWDPEQDQLVTRTCFGITQDHDNRQNGYEGHVGHAVKFSHIWSGPSRLIRELESKVKQEFREYLFCGHRNYVYEWILEPIELEQIAAWVDWEIAEIATVSRVV